MTEIETLLRNNPDLPVLFVSDPVNGDLFEFGTWEELEGERDARQADGEDVELTRRSRQPSRLRLLRGTGQRTPHSPLN